MDGLTRAAAAVGIVAGLCAIAAFVFDYGPVTLDGWRDAGGGGSGSAFCDDPDLSLSQGQGPSGTTITVSGTGFLANEEVDLTFHTESLGGAQANDDGTFSQQVTIPGSLDAFAPQNFDLRARAKACSDRVTFRLTERSS